MRSEQEVLELLTRWAEARDNVRAVILTGSRADPGRAPDALSDYDVEIFVRDVEPFVQDDAWMGDFGETLVRWPLSPGPTFSPDWITQLVLYQDGVRLDFQITSLSPSASDNLDHGFRVLVDKDGASARLPRPTRQRHAIRLPSAEDFADRLNAFWWDVIHVAKALHRGELNYAKYMLDAIIRSGQLQPLLEWRVALGRDGPMDTGIHGRWLHKYLDARTWEIYTRTFAGPAIEDNWQALFAAVELVRDVGREVAEALGFDYPQETDRRVFAYIQVVMVLQPKS